MIKRNILGANRRAIWIAGGSHSIVEIPGTGIQTTLGETRFKRTAAALLDWFGSIHVNGSLG